MYRAYLRRTQIYRRGSGAFLLQYNPEPVQNSIAQLIRNGVSLDDIFEATKITKYFLEVMKNIVDYETVLSQNVGNREILKTAKKTGFSDQIIAKLWNTP